MNQQQKAATLRNGAQTSPPLQATEPEPPANTAEMWEWIVRLAIVGTGLIVLVAAFHFARSLLMPVMAAMLIGITLSPIQKRAAERGIPPFITAVALVLLFFGGVYLGASLLVGPLTDWAAQAPELGETIKEKLRYLERPLGAARELLTAMGAAAGEGGQKVSIETSLAEIGRQTVAILTPALTEFIIFFGTLLFFLVGINRMRRQLIVYFGTRDARLRVVRIWSDIEQNLIAYLGAVTAINIGLGIVTAAMLYLLGMPNPLALGVLAAALNYIPFIGPAMFALTLFVVGFLAMPTLGGALAAPALFVAITTVEGHFITPSVIGRSLTLSPFLVFLALVFWTWLWGPLGAFLATPLLIVGLVLLSHLFPRDEVELPK